MRKTAYSWLVGTLLLCAITATATAQEKRTLDILGRRDASMAIQYGPRQSGVQVFAADADLQGIRTNAVHGEYSALDAARRLVEGTGLEVVSTGDKTITIRRPPSDVSDRKPAHRAGELGRDSRRSSSPARASRAPALRLMQAAMGRDDSNRSSSAAYTTYTAQP